MTAFQRLCIVSCAVIFGLIILGGVVRATDSGLGCPDWPRCHGSFIPRWETHTLIEYSHRFTASIAGVLIVAVLVVAWRNYRRVPAIVIPTTVAFALLLVQAGLGGAAVLNELPPEIVTVHLGTALATLTLLLIVTTASFALNGSLRRPMVSRGFAAFAAGIAVGTLFLMLVGSYLSGAGYGLACSGWPLCNNEAIPSAELASVQMVFLHRILALGVGALVLALVWLGWKQRETAPSAFPVSLMVLGIFLLQGLLGAANVWTRLADGISAAHLALGTLLWTLLAVLNIRVHGLYALLPLTSRSHGPVHETGAERAAGTAR